MASAAPQIAITSRLKEAAELVNRVNTQKFPFMLSRILGKLHLRNKHIFNEAERDQLRSLFALSDRDLETVLQACAYIYQQAAYHTIHPRALASTLTDAGMDEDHAKAMSQVWAEGATDFVNELKKHTMSGPSQLTGSQYRLHLMLGETELTRIQDPTALFEFSLGNPDASNEEDRKDESVIVEFSHSELYALFQKLESVQGQLDRLS